jgi:hypothetical protein
VTVRTSARHRRPPALAGTSGPAGNEHLTALTGASLLVGFAIEGGTIVALHRLMWLHFAVGFLLCGPVALKIGATLYRFARYYTGAPPYVRKGPPAPILRLLGPMVVSTSIAVLGTGVILAFAGPGNGPWLALHKVSFVLWFGAMTIHVLAYAPKLPQLLTRRRLHDGRPAPAAAPGGPARYLALALAIAGGVLVAAVWMHLSGQWNSFYGG